ncbi:MAG: hypothetical protein IPM42_21160 [Saprospiraceae bacterium]|nr:hypothetical protein [Saprospiraceae bacterium]
MMKIIILILQYLLFVLLIYGCAKEKNNKGKIQHDIEFSRIGDINTEIVDKVNQSLQKCFNSRFRSKPILIATCGMGDRICYVDKGDIVGDISDYSLIGFKNLSESDLILINNENGSFISSCFFFNDDFELKGWDDTYSKINQYYSPCFVTLKPNESYYYITDLIRYEKSKFMSLQVIYSYTIYLKEKDSIYYNWIKFPEKTLLKDPTLFFQEYENKIEDEKLKELTKFFTEQYLDTITKNYQDSLIKYWIKCEL